VPTQPYPPMPGYPEQGQYPPQYPTIHSPGQGFNIPPNPPIYPGQVMSQTLPYPPN
jgi:hypothetical protein